MEKLIIVLLSIVILLSLLQYDVGHRKYSWRCEGKLVQLWTYTHSSGQLASWYGKFHHGRTMANGKKYNMYAITVAHPTIKLGTLVRVTNLKNDLFVYARVTDRGPYIKGRIVDVSYASACKLKMVRDGIVPCRVEVVHGLTTMKGVIT